MILSDIFLLEKYLPNQAQNALGRPIASNDIALNNFWKWFGKSKAVDASGRPVVLYHGTKHDFTSFDPEKSAHKGAIDVPSAYFFAKMPDVAQSYAGQKTTKEHLPDEYWEEFRRLLHSGREQQAGEFFDKHKIKNHKEWDLGANVMPVYLRMLKPLRVSAKGLYWNEIPFEGDYLCTRDLILVAKERGYDSIILANVHDRADGKGKATTVYIVLNQNQIKSALTNTGSYSHDSHIDESILLEKGIMTAAIDTMATQALYTKLPQALNKIIDEVYTSPVADDNYDSSNEYQKVYDIIKDKDRFLCDEVCDAISDILTDVVNQYVSKTFPPAILKAAFEKNRTSIHGGYRVAIDAKEYSLDQYREKYGGYFQKALALIKIFLKREEILELLCAQAATEILGESEIDVGKRAAHLLVPIFNHEYAHLEQDIRGNPMNSRNRGYLSVIDDKEKQKRKDLVSGRRKVSGKLKGKRGGGGNDIDNNVTDYLKYVGSNHEIDSFAAGAAGEMVSTVAGREGRRFSASDYNQSIKSIMTDIRDGWAEGHSFKRYENIMRKTLDGYYKEQNVKPEEMQEVWNRFKSLVYIKLNDYLKPVVGKADASMTETFKKDWVQMAKKAKNRKQVMIDIVFDVASEIIRDCPEYKNIDDLQKMMAEADGKRLSEWNFDLYNEGRKFLLHFFYGNDWEENPNETKMLQIYSNMVANHMKRLLIYR